MTAVAVSATSQQTTAALAVRGLSKRYPGVHALDNVAFSLRGGEVRALLGKNGAGKSTLVKILSGAVNADAGEVVIDGRATQLGSPAAARAEGIAAVYQELSLVPELSAAENILLGRWAHRGHARLGIVDRRTMADQAAQLLADLEVDIDVHRKVARLSVAEQQVVEIAKALSHRPRVLILDEPTSSLPAHEVDVLIGLVRRLAARGVAVIYVSHRMKEIPRVGDSVTVLRDGRHIATLPIDQASTERVVELMTGGALGHEQRPRQNARGRRLLRVRDLTRSGHFEHVSLDLHAGEIVGLAGLLGSGRTELLRCIYGVDRADSGNVTVVDATGDRRGPRQMIRNGVGFTPENRKKDGLALGLSVADNLVMSAYDHLARAGWIKRGKERRLARASLQSLAVKAASEQVPVGLLSGGNQQKVVLGKCLNGRARVLLMDEPTRGVDVDAKGQLYELMRQLADDDKAVLFVSSELEELLLACDRVLVLHHGHLVADVPAAHTNLDRLMALAMEGART